MALNTEFRTALIEESAQWFRQRFHYSTLPLSPERIRFWNMTMEELGADQYVEQNIWQNYRVFRSLGWSMLCSILILLPWVSGFGFMSIFWMGLMLGSCVIFPAAWAYNTRIIYEVRDDPDCGPDIVHHIALACLDSNALRGTLHWILELLLLPARTSFRHGLALRVRQLCCDHQKLDFDLQEFPPRWQRGHSLALKLEEILGENGLQTLIRYL